MDRWAMATVRLMDGAEEVAEGQSGRIMEKFVCKECNFIMKVKMYKEPVEFLEKRCDVIGWSEV